MKKVVLVLGAIVLSCQMNAQKLWKDEVDDFTGDIKKFTNYYNLNKMIGICPIIFFCRGKHKSTDISKRINPA